MKQKKGTIVDWSVSMGLFIVAVATSIAFFGPAIQTQKDLHPLVKIVEERMLKNLTYGIMQVPIFIHALHDQTPPPAQPVELHIDSNPSWTLSNVDPVSYANIQAILSPSKLRIQCTSGICTSQSFTLTAYPTGQQNFNLQMSCLPSLRYCDATLGSAYEIKGLQKSALLSANYAQIKSRIGFPAANDFEISLDKGSGPQHILGPTPPQTGNRFSSQIKDWFLYQNGNREPVTIGVTVW